MNTCEYAYGRMLSLAMFCLVWNAVGGFGTVVSAEDRQPVRIEMGNNLDAGIVARLHPDSDLPELQVYDMAGGSVFRDVLIDGNDVHAATGDGVVEYALERSGATTKAEYRKSSGLPSSNAFVIRMDARGGIWCMCEGGIGYRGKGEKKWASYTKGDGLPRGTITSLTLSADGNQIWVTTTGGVAFTCIDRVRWRCYSAKNAINVLPCPNGRWAWCRRLMSCGPQYMGGRYAITEQLDISSGQWRYVPGSGGSPGGAIIPVMWCRATGTVWLARSDGPPVAYDPNAGKSISWSKFPLWGQIENGQEVNSDRFGKEYACEEDGRKVWCATQVGVWLYQQPTDRLFCYRWLESPGGGSVVLSWGPGNKRLYWVCGGRIGVFDVQRKEFDDVWHYAEEKVGDPRWVALSPDEKAVWVIGDRGTLARDLPARSNTYIAKGMSSLTCAPSMVRCVPAMNAAVICGAGGGVVCEYTGKILYPLLRE